jgi:hypothetical protein
VSPTTAAGSDGGRGSRSASSVEGDSSGDGRTPSPPQERSPSYIRRHANPWKRLSKVRRSRAADESSTADSGTFEEDGVFAPPKDDTSGFAATFGDGGSRGPSPDVVDKVKERQSLRDRLVNANSRDRSRSRDRSQSRSRSRSRSTSNSRSARASVESSHEFEDPPVTQVQGRGSAAVSDDGDAAVVASETKQIYVRRLFGVITCVHRPLLCFFPHQLFAGSLHPHHPPLHAITAHHNHSRSVYASTHPLAHHSHNQHYKSSSSSMSPQLSLFFCVHTTRFVATCAGAAAAK